MKCLHGDLEKPFPDVVNIKSGLCWRTPDVGEASTLGYLPKTAIGRAWNQPIGEGLSQSRNLEGIGDLKSPLTADMVMQDLEFFLLGFTLALVPYFFTILPFLPFVMVMSILCHWKNGILLLVLQIFTVKK